MLARNAELRVRELDARQTAFVSRLDALSQAVTRVAATRGLSTARATAVDPAIAALVTQVDAETAALRAAATSVGAPGIVQAIADALASLVEADARGREYLADSQEFLAADLLVSAEGDTFVTIGSRLDELRAAEAAAAAATRRTVRLEALTAIAGAAGLWLVGVLLLLPRAQAPRVAAAETALPAPAVSQATASEAGVDLAAAAALCTDFSRLATSAALPELLARAATLLDARGLIVWLGAGEELFVAAAHGYDPRMVTRLGPIARSSTNATAKAWRTGTLASVAGASGSSAAIVAPMFNPSDCVGVLAAEVPPGREDDPTTRAVAAMLAAQLATAVGAWPAASTDSGESTASTGPVESAAG